MILVRFLAHLTKAALAFAIILCQFSVFCPSVIHIVVYISHLTSPLKKNYWVHGYQTFAVMLFTMSSTKILISS